MHQKTNTGDGTTWEKKRRKQEQRWIGYINRDMKAIRTTKDEVCDRTIIVKWEWVEDENCIVLF